MQRHESGSVQHLPGIALQMTTTSPEREGQALTYSFSGPASAPVWLALSLRPDGRYPPQLTGSALVSVPLLSWRSDFQAQSARFVLARRDARPA